MNEHARTIQVQTYRLAAFANYIPFGLVEKGRATPWRKQTSKTMLAQWRISVAVLVVHFQEVVSWLSAHCKYNMTKLLAQCSCSLSLHQEIIEEKK